MRIALIAVLFAAPALFAQQRNVTSPTGFGRQMFPGGISPTAAATGASPFGRMIYPGTGGPPAPVNVRNPGLGRPSVPPPGAPHPSHPIARPGNGNGYGNRYGNNYGYSGLVGYPVYLAGNYLEYDAPQAPLASDYYTQTPQSEMAPVVIINQYFRPDAPLPLPDVQRPAPAPAPVQESRVATENQEKETIFLIAMKDHTIYAANAYWVEDGTLNYITIQGSENSVSMDLVDRELSRRLNRDRQVAFGLPKN